jgi:2-methylisocitrate lyase-like PEP mutase family enzyme
MIQSHRKEGAMNAAKKFRRMLANHEVIVAPGVYDCVSAKISEKVGFPAVYMGSFITNAAIYGKPDVGLITSTEMISYARNITGSVEVPVLADADTGYGNPLNVIRTVQEYEKAGVAGLHIEDQGFPKKCGHMPGRCVIPTEDMVAKIKAAVDARVNDDFVIVARSDSYSEYGIDELIERGQAYIEAGADAFFPILYTSKNLKEEMKRVRSSFDVPLMFTLTHYGEVSFMTVQEVVEMGYRLLVSPWGALAFASHAVMEFMKELKDTGSVKGFADRMISFDDFTDILGLPEINALESKYGVRS